MSEQYTKARFWKCALQVNPAGYIINRGDGHNHGMNEEQYNQELLRIAQENGIEVIGLADHGNVDSVDAIRELMNAHGILVFPGFEIASSEKAHFVCLFSEHTSRDDLIGYMAKLEIDTKNPTYPSKLSAEQILEKIDELNGFIYAAHCINDNGVLKLKLNHVWKNIRLKATQIPATLDESGNENHGYRNILLNKDEAYKRDSSITIINAKDVAKPDDLANPTASCLVKMTKPSFEAFKLAFQDAESRIRLNSENFINHYSCIESLKIIGGYLDGVSIEFSEHLNTVIGGRGTGKSTLLECIRYVLQLEPISKKAKQQHEEIIKENLGKTKARVELVIRSKKMNGKRFIIARSYGQNATVKDEQGKISTFTPLDLLPAIEIYGQNEIYDIAQDTAMQRQLLTRFIDDTQQATTTRIRETLHKLAKNREELVKAQQQVATVEDEVMHLPKLEEQLKQLNELGLQDKLAVLPLLETEKRLQNRVIEEEMANIATSFQTIREQLPDTIFLSETVIASLPHADSLREMREILNTLRSDSEQLLVDWQTKYDVAVAAIRSCNDALQKQIKQEEAKLEDSFKKLPVLEGKSGRQVGVEFQQIVQKIERIRPQQQQLEQRKWIVHELRQQRKAILDELSALRAESSAQFERSLKKLNRQLSGKLRLRNAYESDREPVIQFLLKCQLENVATQRLAWIKDTSDFSPIRLAELIRDGVIALQTSDWNITSTVATALTRMTNQQILELEEIELPDSIEIELNIAHESAENFKSLNKLSTGQQCTAILHLLLLENSDPLIMDQPEDNLDNAFIADRIVAELRSEKIKRQFIFATHNANIPVFGDAEWIGVFETQENQAVMPKESQGGIDVPFIREKAADILDGGKMAFNQRKTKYGF